MDENVKTDNQKDACCCGEGNAAEKPIQWKKPILEDVSGRIMAQPYIRFT